MTDIDADGFRPVATAPRDRRWIELRFGGEGMSAQLRRIRFARSAGNGDMPDIWRFSDGGALRYADERGWSWRPIADAAVVAALRAEDRVQQG